jgi:hypothetical protein
MQREYYYISNKVQDAILIDNESKHKIDSICCWLCSRNKGIPDRIPDVRLESRFSKVNFGWMCNKVSLSYLSDSFCDYFKDFPLEESLIFGRIFDSKGRLINGYRTVMPKFRIQLYGDNYKNEVCRNCGVHFVDWIRGKFLVNLSEIPLNLPIVGIFGYSSFLVDARIAKKMKEDKLKHVSIYKVYEKSKKIISQTEIKDFLSFEDLNQYPYFENAKIPN